MEKDKQPNYNLGMRNLDIDADMAFIDSILKDYRLEAEQGVRGLVVDIAYTLARDKLVEAYRFTKLANRTNITVEDFEMAHMDENAELNKCLDTLKNMDLNQETLPKPSKEKGLMLPNWRNCQVGVMPELGHPAEMKPPTKVVHGRPVIRRGGVPRNPIIHPFSILRTNGGADRPVRTATPKGSSGTQGAPFVAIRSGSLPPVFKKARQN